MGGRIRTGIGGWSYPPWRETFYPRGVRRADELKYASGVLATLEINVTFQAAQTPETFARWASETPEGFIFAVKASRACVNRRVLAEAGEAIDRFLGQGLTRLGDRLGPILWQLAPTKVFDPVDIAAFLALLPPAWDGRRLRHCIEARHASFADHRFIDLCRERSVAICLADSPKFPLIEARTADFVYARLMRGEDDIPTGYPLEALDVWARRLREATADGGEAFVYFINAGKVRAPAAALSLTERLGTFC